MGNCPDTPCDMVWKFLGIWLLFEAAAALPPVGVEFVREEEGAWEGSNAGLLPAAQGGGRLVEDKESGVFGEEPSVFNLLVGGVSA